MGQVLDLSVQVALTAHAGQFRAGTAIPFAVHPLECVALLEGAPEAVQAAAVLHDVVEDTPMTSYEIERLVGAEVACIVAEVTDPEGMVGRLAKARSLRHAAAGGYSDAAALVKIADSISNARDLGRRPPPWSPAKVSGYTRYLKALVGLLRVRTARTEALAREFDLIGDAIAEGRSES